MFMYSVAEKLHCVPKTLENKPILIVFGTLNPEGTSH